MVMLLADWTRTMTVNNTPPNIMATMRSRSETSCRRVYMRTNHQNDCVVERSLILYAANLRTVVLIWQLLPTCRFTINETMIVTTGLLLNSNEFNQGYGPRRQIWTYTYRQDTLAMGFLGHSLNQPVEFCND